MKVTIISWLVLLTGFSTVLFAGEPVLERKTAFLDGNRLFLQARAVVFPTNAPSGIEPEAFITMSIYGTGTHAYGDIYLMKNAGLGETWSEPKSIPALKRETTSEGLHRVFGDITPDWHAKSGTVLCTGKSFFSKPEDADNKAGGKRIDLETKQEVAYAVYRPSTDSWSPLRAVEFPKKLDNGDDFYCVNAGCTQRVDLPNGDVLLPIRYLKGKLYVSTVILCSFDGEKLVYRKHGTTHTVPVGRGLYEPSLAFYRDKYYLTLRGENAGFVAVSDDGLHFDEPAEWTFDDDKPLGSYNTQQHWLSSPDGLYLVYTRRGADNDQVFRHRAPLFIGRVDTEKRRVLRDTEQIVFPIPEGDGDVGNFGVTKINENEYWIVAPVVPKKGRQTEILLTRLKWAKTSNE